MLFQNELTNILIKNEIDPNHRVTIALIIEEKNMASDFHALVDMLNICHQMPQYGINVTQYPNLTFKIEEKKAVPIVDELNKLVQNGQLCFVEHTDGLVQITNANADQLLDTVKITRGADDKRQLSTNKLTKQLTGQLTN